MDFLYEKNIATFVF
uniref:Uncharacterized protein n=1 Tax=Anguilla anguilla TaxID=7936 RepID=A0A0E9SJ74_ANGAN